MASRSAGVYLDINEELRDIRRGAMLRVDDLDMFRGAGTLRRFRLLDREMLSGVISPSPGSGGNGLFLWALSARDMVLFMLRGNLGYGWSKTPAAAGDMIEKVRLAWRYSATFCRSVSEIKLDIDEFEL